MNCVQETPIDALVIGSSAGGMQVLCTILPQLPKSILYPVFIVTHQKANAKHYLVDIFREVCAQPVCETEDKMRIEPGHIYVAAADYHMLIESTDRLALSVDDPVHSCRPSIDILFDSAADIFKSRVFGVICTGMGCDGADGLLVIHEAGGRCAVQEPASAEFPSMPEAALIKVPAAIRFNPDAFGALVVKILSTNDTN